MFVDANFYTSPLNPKVPKPFQSLITNCSIDLSLIRGIYTLLNNTYAEHINQANWRQCNLNLHKESECCPNH